MVNLGLGVVVLVALGVHALIHVRSLKAEREQMRVVRRIDKVLRIWAMTWTDATVREQLMAVYRNGH